MIEAKIQILVEYDRKWKNDLNGAQSQTWCQTQDYIVTNLLIAKSKIGYDYLLKKLYKRLAIDREQFKLRISYISSLFRHDEPIKIYDDKSFEGYLLDVGSNDLKS